MADIPVIQVLEKERYFTQHLVSLPNEVPYTPLTSPSSIRTRTKVMALTINNLTYAKLGFLLSWWDVHPLPPTTPAPYNDTTKYGRINCWGFAEVLESTFPAAPKGSYLWGYHPIGTLAQDLEVKGGSIPGQVFVTSAYRQHIMPIYNRYVVYPASLKGQIDAREDGPAYDAIVKVMFETGYLMSQFIFTSDPKETLHPGMDSSSAWTPEQADLGGATVILLAPGSKAGLAFAYGLQNGRSGAKPKRVVGAASEFSKKFVEGTGVYDEVVLSSEAPADVLSRLQVQPGEKVALFNFGGRGRAGETWAQALGAIHSNFLNVGVGSEITETSQADVLKAMAPKPGAGAIPTISVNAGDMRNRAMDKKGEKKYWDDFDAAWKEYRAQGIKGFRITWGEGMEDVKNGWDTLCQGTADPYEGLAYVI